MSARKLVLLRPTDDEGQPTSTATTAATTSGWACSRPPSPRLCQAETRAELAAYRRLQARERCTMLLRCLTGVAITTGVLGVFPGMHLAWIFTGLSGVALLALVALIGYAREIEVQFERERRRSGPAFTSLEVDSSGNFYDYEDVAVGAAEAGYPGAWDDYELPRQAAGGR